MPLEKCSLQYTIKKIKHEKSNSKISTSADNALSIHDEYWERRQSDSCANRKGEGGSEKERVGH